MRSSLTAWLLSFTVACAAAPRVKPPKMAPTTADRAKTLSDVPMSWSTGGQPGEYTGQGTGNTTHPDGATLSLSSTGTTPKGFGTVITQIPADQFRSARVQLVGEIRTHGVTNGGASLWLRVDGPGSISLLDNGTDRAIHGDSGWVEMSIVLPVIRDATRLTFGALLSGPGSMDVQQLRLEVMNASRGAATGEAKKELDAAVNLVRNRSMWRDTVSWNVVLPEVAELTSGASASADAYPAIRVLLARLGDHHSFFMPPRATTAFRTGGAQNPPAHVEALSDGIGYIAVPAYSGVDTTASRNYAATVLASLTATMPKARCGWIVDVRGNGGGNMHPMLAGLKPFLGNGPLGSFIAPGNEKSSWTPPHALLWRTNGRSLHGQRNAAASRRRDDRAHHCHRGRSHRRSLWQQGESG